MILFWSSVAASAVAIVGCAYLLMAAILLRSLARRRSGMCSAAAPSVTILKPLCGDEPGLLDNLRSFCIQDYPGNVQIIFGVQEPHDSAIATVERLRRVLPGSDLDLVIDLERRGVSPRLAFVANASVQTVPAMVERAGQITAAQRARGLDTEGSVWSRIRGIVPIVGPVILTIGVMMLFAREINLLLLGDETAQGLGVSVARTRLLLLAVACLATGAAVSVAGPIGFIGLVVPHVLRLIVGPDYRLLLPASALGGAIFLVATDTISRLVLQPAELQVGIVTALLGAPFFLFLLYRNRKLIRTL